MSGVHLSELCRGSDIDAIVALLRQVAPPAESLSAEDADLIAPQESGYPDRNGIWGYQDGDGRTALHWAVSFKNFELARKLMHPPYSSPVLTEDEELSTPFTTACCVGAPVDVLMELLQRSAAELAEYTKWKTRLLQRLTPKEEPLDEPAQGDTAAAPPAEAKPVVKSDVPGVVMPQDVSPESMAAIIVNAEEETGQTPLVLAASRGYLDTVRFLVEHGADLSHQNSRGQSALHCAVSRGNMDLVEYLVTASEKANGANKAAHRRFMNLQDSRGDSPLFYASMENNADIGQFLLRRGADRELRNKDGKNFWDV